MLNRFVTGFFFMSAALACMVRSVLTEHKIIRHPIDTLAIEGRDAQLNCTVKLDGPAPPMKWYIHDATVAKNILTDGNFVYEPYIYSIDGNQDQGEYNLVISNATSDLQAVYICVLTVDLTTNATLYIIEKGPICMVQPGNIAIVNTPTYFNCTADNGVPPGKTVWTKDDTAVSTVSTPEHLYTTTFNRHDNGTVFNCGIKHPTLSTEEEDLLVCSEPLVIQVQYDPELTIIIHGSASDTGKVVEGDGVTFECDVIEANPAEVTVLWQSHDIITEDNWLNFTKVLREHHGEYTCVANNTFWDGSPGTGMVNVSVDVQYSPEIIMFDNVTYAIEGREFMIVCQVSGNPTPGIQWLYNGNQVSQTETLQYEDIQRHQSGEYTCEANNTFWNNETAMEDEALYLKVQYLPTVDIVGPSAAAAEGKTQVTVTCTATDGVPDPTSLVLLHVNETVNQVDSVENQDGITNKTFDLGVMQRWNNGSYYCEANTTFADQSVDSAKSTKIPIIVHYKPSISDKDNETVDVTIGSSVSLNCTVDAYPDANVTWTKDGGIVDIGENSTIYTITNVVEDDEGKYICTAENYLGRDQREIQLNVILSQGQASTPLIAGVCAGIPVLIAVSEMRRFHL